MKVGDLVRVKQTYGTPIVGIVVRLNNWGRRPCAITG